MKEIKLTQGKVALVDDEDYENLNKYKWHLLKSRANNYAVRSIRNNGKRGSIRMHRVVNKTPSNLETDHINGDGLDNRRSNLRNATSSQNKVNRHCKNKTGFRGIRKYRNGWRVRIRNNNKCLDLGTFLAPEEAADAYDKKAKELYGDYAILNAVDPESWNTSQEPSV